MLKSSIEYDKEDLKILINDQKLDIKVLDYIEIENKYDWYLKAFRFFGNFATFEHIAAILKGKYGRTKVFKDLNKMCSMSLLRKEALGKYVYFVLTKKAQIYLKQKNNVGYIANPSDKAMKSNLLLGDYLLNNRLNLTTETIRSSDNQISMLISEFSNYEEYIKLCYKFLYNKMKNIDGIETDFLQEQISLINKKSEFIDNTDKLKAERNCDILSDLMSKDIYLINVESKTNDITITFLIQDIGRSVSWYKLEILKLCSIIAKFYLNPVENYIKCNLIIQTDSIENKNNLIKVQNIFNNLKKSREFAVEDMLRWGTVETRYMGSYFRHRGDLPWALNDISIVEYNTVRFLETKSDKINTIENNQVNIIDFSLNTGGRIYGE